MLYIDPNSSKIQKAAYNFLKEIKPRVISKIEDLPEGELKDYFEDNITPKLNDILVGHPFVIYPLNEVLKNDIDVIPGLKAAVIAVFDYDDFIIKRKKKYCAYHLAEAINIRSCVYCNLNYAVTIRENGKNLVRPDFDHFLDKSTNPLLSLSFFNLIPSCGTCNQKLKNTIHFEYGMQQHPYEDDLLDDFHFSYRYNNKSIDGLEIVLNQENPEGKIGKSFEDLRMIKIYNGYTQELHDLLKIRQAFSDKYLSNLGSQVLDGLKISDEELYRLAFGTYISKEDYINRPFSKFKRDILGELGIIKE